MTASLLSRSSPAANLRNLFGTLAALSALSAHGATITIDNFESPSSPKPWTFSNGPEFPGASGSLSSSVGHTGKGAHLAYNFTGGGNYVAANLNLPSPLTAAAVSFWIRTPRGCWTTLRVHDSSGQTLQYALSRPLEARASSAWYQQVVELDAPTLHFAGANDGILHQPITAISIMANNFAQFGLEKGLTGSIDFDEVAVINPLQCDINPFDPAIVGPPPGKTNLLADLGVQIHFTADTAALDAIRDAGFSWVRMDLFWASVEKEPGVYDFSDFDALLTQLEARGLKALFTFDFSNPLHSDCPPGSSADYCAVYAPQSPSTINAFANYAQAATNHFRGHGVRYEVWNEPNWPAFWTPTPNATKYSALASATIASAHVGDPTALVITGGLTGFDFKFTRGILSAGGAADADGFGVHAARHTGAETATDELVHMHSILDANAATHGLPVWDTEWGYSSQWFGGNGTTATARTRQAVLVLRKVLSVQVMGLPMSIYYDIRDDGTSGTNAEHNFGLLANNYTDKPAMTAMRTLKAMTTGRTFAGTLPVQPTSLHALRLDGATDAIIILWSDQPGGHINATLPAPATAVDMFGARLTLTTSNGRVTVPVKEKKGPVYVTVSRAGQVASMSGD